MVNVGGMQHRATDLYARLGTGELYDEAKRRKMSLSALLEDEDASDPAELRSGEDAFTRVMAEADITVMSAPQLGFYSDPVEKFRENRANELLFPEFVARRWRSQQRAVAQYFSNEFAAGTIQRPYQDNLVVRQAQVQPAIPLEEVVAMTTPVTQADYRTLRLTEPTAAQIRLVRIGEAADVPRVKLTTSPNTISTHKFGRALEASYETLRRMRIDILAIQIDRMALQNVVDQVSAAMDVAINGDGNANTSATNYNLTTLDAAASVGTLTAKAWLRFRMKFTNPYVATVAFAQEDVALQMELLSLGSANLLLSTNAAAMGLGRPFTPINQSLADGMRLGITTDAPANTIVAMDARFGIEHIIEIGSLVNEAERWITRQVEVMTMSENEAFGVNDPRATKTLYLGA